jgi:hypothetical protein
MRDVTKPIKIHEDNDDDYSDEETQIPKSKSSSKFISEKSKFKQDLMMSSTIPYGKGKIAS